MVLLLIAVPVVICVAGGYLLFRSRMKQLPRTIRQQREAPFTYGVCPPPWPGSTSTQTLSVAGQPATLSTLDPRASPNIHPGYDSGMPYDVDGRLTLEVSLGPDWPGLVVQERGAVQRVGQFLAHHHDLDPPELPTGDPAFDQRYRCAMVVGTPDAARRILNPQVLGALQQPPVSWMNTGHTVRIEYLVASGRSPEDYVPAAIRTAETIIGTSGIPVYAGPPRVFTPSP